MHGFNFVRIIIYSEHIYIYIYTRVARVYSAFFSALPMLQGKLIDSNTLVLDHSHFDYHKAYIPCYWILRKQCSVYTTNLYEPKGPFLFRHISIYICVDFFFNFVKIMELCMKNKGFVLIFRRIYSSFQLTETLFRLLCPSYF